MDAAGIPRSVVVDANVLINLIQVHHLDLLGGLPGWRFLVPPEVEAEIRDPNQSKGLREGIEKGVIERISLQTMTELAIYGDLVRFLGKGEAACLALAQPRGWCVASDERRAFLRQAEERLGQGRVLTTPGILVLAIREGLLSVEEADHLKDRLERCRFRMRFRSFRDILERDG